MDEDEEIRREIWNGAVPIVFTLTPNEVITLQAPLPLYMLLPRVSYLPLVAPAIRTHFQTYTATIVDEIWFSWKGKPIKWHYPIGVLFDLLGSPDQLPWNITVHFQGFPSEQLMRCKNTEFVKSCFFNVLKESNYIKHGDANKFNGLSVADSNGLWEGLFLGDYSKFWNSNAKLVADVRSMKNVPIRLLRRGENFHIIQEPVSAVDANGTPRSFKSILEEMLPEVFGDSTREETSAKAMVHGTFPSLEIPIYWLSENCCHPDNFLYVIVVE